MGEFLIVIGIFFVLTAYWWIPILSMIIRGIAGHGHRPGIDD